MTSYEEARLGTRDPSCISLSKNCSANCIPKTEVPLANQGAPIGAPGPDPAIHLKVPPFLDAGVEKGVVADGVEGLEVDAVVEIGDMVDAVNGAVCDGEGDIEVGVEEGVLHPTAKRIPKSERAIKIKVRFIAFSPY